MDVQPGILHHQIRVFVDGAVVCEAHREELLDASMPEVTPPTATADNAVAEVAICVPNERPQPLGANDPTLAAEMQC